MKKYDHLVFICRAQPFHYGHASIISHALELASHVHIILGSSNIARNTRNPFTQQEREEMIMRYFNWALSRIHCIPMNDYLYQKDKWLTVVQELVHLSISKIDGWSDYPPKIGLIGHSKDNSSYYLNLFPQWGDNPINVPFYSGENENFSIMTDSTEIRRMLFGETTGVLPWFQDNDMVPDSTIEFLTDFTKRVEWSDLCDDYKYSIKYDADHSFPDLPYKPIHCTVDACVIQSGHVLLIRRKARPGKGLMALPGGFVNASEFIVDSMLRELKEETKIKVPSPILRGNITQQHIFDEPHRSIRGRVISNGFKIELPPQKSLPKVRGGSDATKAFWVPLSELNPKDFFEDHYHIIQYFTS